jgi:tRNA pseudouridine38-40 synthase
MRPLDVQITGIAPTPTMVSGDVFHASLSSKVKTYEYRISTGYVHDPNTLRFVWHVGNADLDLKAMVTACQMLEGSHDFSAFQGAPRGPDDKRRRETQNTACTLSSMSFLEDDPPMRDDLYFVGVNPPIRNFKFTVTGDRFLYRMVRFLVGACVAVGNRKMEVTDVQRALATGNWDIPDDKEGRRKQFECAPAHGLVLRHVDYGDDISFHWQPLRELD